MSSMWLLIGFLLVSAKAQKAPANEAQGAATLLMPAPTLMSPSPISSISSESTPVWLGARSNANLSVCQGRVATTGLGSAKVLNDQGLVDLTVTSTAPSVSEAQALAQNASSNIKQALEPFHIPRQDIETTNFNIQEEQAFVCLDSRGNEVATSLQGMAGVRCNNERTGFTVSNSLVVTLRGSNVNTTLSKALDLMIAAGGDQARVNGVSFSASDPLKQEAVKRARELAIQDALARLMPLVETLAIQLGPFIEINANDQISSTGQQPQFDLAGGASFAAKAAPATSLSSGGSSVDSSLNMIIATCN